MFRPCQRLDRDDPVAEVLDYLCWLHEEFCHDANPRCKVSHYRQLITSFRPGVLFLLKLNTYRDEMPQPFHAEYQKNIKLHHQILTREEWNFFST